MLANLPLIIPASPSETTDPKPPSARIAPPESEWSADSLRVPFAIAGQENPLFPRLIDEHVDLMYSSSEIALSGAAPADDDGQLVLASAHSQPAELAAETSTLNELLADGASAQQARPIVPRNDPTSSANSQDQTSPGSPIQESKTKGQQHETERRELAIGTGPGNLGPSLLREFEQTFGFGPIEFTPSEYGPPLQSSSFVEPPSLADLSGGSFKTVAELARVQTDDDRKTAEFLRIPLRAVKPFLSFETPSGLSPAIAVVGSQHSAISNSLPEIVGETSPASHAPWARLAQRLSSTHQDSAVASAGAAVAAEASRVDRPSEPSEVTRPHTEVTQAGPTDSAPAVSRDGTDAVRTPFTPPAEIVHRDRGKTAHETHRLPSSGDRLSAAAPPAPHRGVRTATTNSSGVQGPAVDDLIPSLGRVEREQSATTPSLRNDSPVVRQFGVPADAAPMLVRTFPAAGGKTNTSQADLSVSSQDARVASDEGGPAAARFDLSEPTVTSLRPGSSDVSLSSLSSNPPRIAQQISDTIVTHAATTEIGETLTLDAVLDPSDLGRLHVRLTRSESGLVAVVSAENSDVHQVIVEQSTSIEQAVRSHMKSDATIQFSAGDSSFSNGSTASDQRAWTHRPHGARQAPRTLDIPVDNPSARRTSRAEIDVLA